MQIEQIRDILDWTVAYHQQMAQCYEHCAGQSESTRIKLLLEYLSTHEKLLTDTISRYESEADPKDLNTWCIEYIDKTPVLAHNLCEAKLNEMDTGEIVNLTANIHNQLIELYQYMVSRAANKRTEELFENLISLEENETMRMVRASESLDDL
jgi:rubrerythrin